MTPEKTRNVLLALIDEVDALFGEDARCAANMRAYNRSVWARDAASGVWLGVFMEAFTDELRRLLHVH